MTALCGASAEGSALISSIGDKLFGDKSKQAPGRFDQPARSDVAMRKGLRLPRKTALVLLGAAAGCALVLLATKPQPVNSRST